MPIYEFDCQNCGEPFEELVFSAASINEVTCPSCGSPKIRKKLSAFTSKVGQHQASASTASGCSTSGL